LKTHTGYRSAAFLIAISFSIQVESLDNYEVYRRKSADEEEDRQAVANEGVKVDLPKNSV